MTEQERQLQIEEKKVEAMVEIASGLNAIADALLQCAAVNKHEVAYALNNIGASIAHLDLGSSKQRK
jgi:hypothetical protein